ncbi:S8 family serine peptidase, partial [Helicobacter sp. 10-6591]|uniref:S8 family serine peptidase n=1 Tax=Helicobacter sp. 10-6591 TaxID=2004998 RepID=UPI000DCE087B
PFVSGAAALVQEKFPDLNGRQIADVLLSTANKKVILKTFTDKNKTQKHTIIVSGQDDKIGTNNDLIVGGTYTQSTDATLTLVFGESGNAKLNATNGYNIANGAKLTFTPQKNVFFTLAGNKISIDMGNMP